MIASAMLLLPLATAAEAQQQVISQRVAKSMPTSYQAPECGLKSGHFKVSSGATYLKTAVEADIPENQKRALDNGEKVLLEAMRRNNQGNNPAAWYYLGRIYLQRGDLYGADSALARAEKMAPECAEEIDGYRRNGWVALIKGGNGFEEQKNLDSALVLYRQAGVVYRKSPIAYYQAAAVFNEQGATDSAAAYYGLAVKASANVKDTTEQKIRNRSAFNQGALLLNSQKHAEAAAAFEQYLKWVPNDVEAKRGLAAAYRGQGQADKAQALEQEIVAAGGSAAGGAGAGAGSADLMNVGVNLYNDKKFAEAAKAFAKVAEAEPYNRDALFNLANTYLALKDGAKLLAAAQRLIAIEPMNENSLKLVGEGHKQAQQVDEAVKVAEQVLALPVDIRVNDFSTGTNTATLTATATGREAQTPAGKPIPAAPVSLAVEFLDAKGAVVASQDVAVPALEPGKSQELKATAQGAGIVAWRYKRK
ncbi:MAG: tetratricopeptide repeat protein [Gemmatimonadales bacterium]